MPQKRTDVAKPVTEGFLSKKIDKVLEVVESNRKVLEARINFMREDAKQQLQSVAEGLNKKVDNIGKELHFTQLAVREVKAESIIHTQRLNHVEGRLDCMDGRLDRMHGRLDLMDSRLGRMENKFDHVIEKVERHDTEISHLKSAVSSR